MGQRLDIELFAGNKSQMMANCYYHWSAYTLSALLTVKAVIENYYKIKDEYKDDPFMLAVKCFEIPDYSFKMNEETGELERVQVYAGLCKSSHKLMKFLYPDTEIHEGADRNVGLISIHPSDVKETRDWEEGRARVYLDAEEFSLDIWFDMSEEEFIEDLLDNYPECDVKRELSHIPKIPDDIPINEDRFPYGLIPFKDIDKIIEFAESFSYRPMEVDPDNVTSVYWYTDSNGNKRYIQIIG